MKDIGFLSGKQWSPLSHFGLHNPFFAINARNNHQYVDCFTRINHTHYSCANSIGAQIKHWQIYCTELCAIVY